MNEKHTSFNNLKNQNEKKFNFLVAKTQIDDISNNYHNIIINQIEILDYIYKNKLSSAVLLSNLAITVELILKHILLNRLDLSYQEVDGYDHNIEKLFSIIESKNRDVFIEYDLENLNYLISNIIKYNGKKINWNECSSFKYNRVKNSSNCIFKKRDETIIRNGVKEVLLWIKSHYQK